MNVCAGCCRRKKLRHGGVLSWVACEVCGERDLCSAQEHWRVTGGRMPAPPLSGPERRTWPENFTGD